MQTVETDVLIVGAGPCGLTAAALLAKYGIKAITLTRHSGVAHTPRAHITNQRTMEVFRDLGFEDRVRAIAMPQEQMGTNVWATSFAGRELARMMSWGAGNDRQCDYRAASPSEMCNAPQVDLEPILHDEARLLGADVRFRTELLRISQDEAGVEALVKEGTTGTEYVIRARYVFAADGARSTVVEQLGFPLHTGSRLGSLFTVWLEADLSKYVQHRSGALFWVVPPGSNVWFSAWTCTRPWGEWNALFSQHPGVPPNASEEAIAALVRASIGDPEVPFRIKRIDTWTINHVVATEYRKGRVLIGGDAAHRHPPANGLGSNTSVQDAWNVAWKLAFVLKGLAGEALLDTYGQERQPIGKQVVDRAIKSIADLQPLAAAIGLRPGQSAEAGWKNLDELFGDSDAGERRRKAMLDALERVNYQLNTNGVELGQRYATGALVDDGTPFPPYTRDPELYYHPTTHPGASLPHVWLQHGTRYVSTLDLVGHGRFTLLVGIRGKAWIDAARTVSEALGVEVVPVSIGLRQPYDDVLGEWTRRREVTDSGCILVRPDRFVAWRSAGAVEDPVAALRGALSTVLSRAA